MKNNITCTTCAPFFWTERESLMYIKSMCEKLSLKLQTISFDGTIGMADQVCYTATTKNFKGEIMYVTAVTIHPLIRAKL